ncbi:MAG: aminotransferase class IV [Candidatus Eisenbacteria bacterium]|uniref:Aminotransferase class IV n=1 Tax=Eiseniibacteriota bacterium TaxID=2212470 RepID=A0A9D6QK72_UNCEI|nr:aminotransferase class IV [Candidatus Eisenbacteria bacterium]
MKRAAAAPARALWIDGRLRRGDEAALSLFDRGARDGEGLFETLRVDGGRPRFWTRHIERLVLSAAVLGFPVPPSPARLRDGIAELLDEGDMADAVVRITVTRGIPGGRPTRTGVWIDAEPVAGRLWRGTRGGAASVIVSKRPFEPGPLGAHKTTSRLAYHLAREEARAARADEALLVSGARLVLEGAASNVFAVIADQVVTPPLSLGILPGITRAVVLGACRAAGLHARERRLTRADLDQADEIFLTGSVQEVVAVGTLDGRARPRGPVAPRLLEAYRAEAARSLG